MFWKRFETWDQSFSTFGNESTKAYNNHNYTQYTLYTGWWITKYGDKLSTFRIFGTSLYVILSVCSKILYSIANTYVLTHHRLNNSQTTNRSRRGKQLKCQHMFETDTWTLNTVNNTVRSYNSKFFKWLSVRLFKFWHYFRFRLLYKSIFFFAGVRSLIYRLPIQFFVV